MHTYFACASRVQLVLCSHASVSPAHNGPHDASCQLVNFYVRGMSRVLRQSDLFNGKGFTFGEPLSRSAKLHVSDGAASNLGEEMIRHYIFLMVLEAGDECWCQAQRYSTVISVFHIDL